MRSLPFGVVHRAAAVRQPSHDRPVAPDYLLSVNTEVLSLFVRPARDHQRPGDEWPCITWPAGLDR